MVPALASLLELPRVPALESLLVMSPFLAPPGLCWRGRRWRLGVAASRPWWVSRQLVSLPLESSLVPALERPLDLALELLRLVPALVSPLESLLELPRVSALELLQLLFSALPRLVSALVSSPLVTALELPLVPALESPLGLALESLPLLLVLAL